MAFQRDTMQQPQSMFKITVILCLLSMVGLMAYMAFSPAGHTQGCPGRTFTLTLQQQQQQQQQQQHGWFHSSKSAQLVSQQPKVAKLAVPLDCEEATPSGSLHNVWMYQQPGGQIIAFTDEGNKTIIRTNLRGAEKRTAVQDVLAHLLVNGCQQQQQEEATGLTQQPLSPPRLFVDVGSNVGWFSVMAAAHSCQVLLFDPQPICVKTIRQHLCLNRQYPMIGSRGLGVAILNNPVSNITGLSVNMSTPDYCAQAFNVDAGLKISKKNEQKRRIIRSSHVAKTVSIDDLLIDSDLDVFFMKVDVEGYERLVLSSIQRLVAARRIQYLVIELTPGFWRQDNVTREQMVEALQPLLLHGCVIQRVLDLNLDAAAVPATATAAAAAAAAAAGGHVQSQVGGDPAHLDSIIDPGKLIDNMDKLKQYIETDLRTQEDIFVRCNSRDHERAQQ